MLRNLFLAFAIIALPFSANADSLGSAAGGVAANQSSMAGGVYNVTPPTLTNGQQAGVQLDVNGNVKTTGTIGSITSITNPIGVKGLDGATIATGFNPVPVIIAPSSTLGVSTSSCTAACASTSVTGAHAIYGISASATVTGWVLVYDAATCSANGTVTPKKAYAYTVANSSLGVSWSDTPMIQATGISVCFSTTGPYTATASTTAFLSVDYK